MTARANWGSGCISRSWHPSGCSGASRGPPSLETIDRVQNALYPSVSNRPRERLGHGNGRPGPDRDRRARRRLSRHPVDARHISRRRELQHMPGAQGHGFLRARRHRTHGASPARSPPTPARRGHQAPDRPASCSSVLAPCAGRPGRRPRHARAASGDASHTARQCAGDPGRREDRRVIAARSASARTGTDDSGAGDDAAIWRGSMQSELAMGGWRGRPRQALTPPGRPLHGRYQGVGPPTLRSPTDAGTDQGLRTERYLPAWAAVLMAAASPMRGLDGPAGACWNGGWTAAGPFRRGPGRLGEGPASRPSRSSHPGR